MTHMLIAGAGGFIGTMLRFAVGALAQRALPATFPYGTCLVNVTGCFAIGALAALADERLGWGPAARFFWITGVLGGYTTFSAFGYETTVLLRDGRALAAALNVGGQILAGLAAVWAGAAAVRSLA